MKLNKQHELVIFDIGERYIKAILIRINWDGSVEYAYNNVQESKGVVDGKITNIRSLSDAIFQLVYKIEIDVGTVIKSVAILFSFSDFNVKQLATSLDIYGETITESHVQNINYRINLGLEQTILGFLYKYYKVDNLDFITNPEQMCGSKLALNSKFLTVENSLIRNLMTSFNRNSIEVNYIGFNNIIPADFLDENFIIIDMGFSSTRVFINMKQENYCDLLIEKIGFKFLLNLLQNEMQISMEKAEKMINVSYDGNNKKAVDISREFFKNIFSQIIYKLQKIDLFNKININIYLSGGLPVIPLINVFLQQTFDLNFEIYETKKNLQSNYNKNIFNNCINLAEYLIQNKGVIHILKLD